jgi:hypothetical protein
MVIFCHGQEQLFRREGVCKTPQTHDPDPCPNCGNLNHPSARQCTRCGQKLEPRVESEVFRA